MTDLLCVGEILWDLFPEGKKLGGAPFNLCFHATKLGLEAVSVSRVGADALGEEILKRAGALQIPVEFIQQDPELPTGTVDVAVDAAGQPTFTITPDVAWDNIQVTDAVMALLPGLKAIAFGSLAQRSPASRQAIRRILAESPAEYKLCDINLRPPFVDKDIIHYSMETANILKLNDQELVTLQEMFQLPAGEAESLRVLCDDFDLAIICVTKGVDGASVYCEYALTSVPGQAVQVADTVGSGDAFSSAFLVKLLQGASPQEAAAAANRLGALVASKAGGTPDLSDDALALI